MAAMRASLDSGAATTVPLQSTGDWQMAQLPRLAPYSLMMLTVQTAWCISLLMR
jgi:hypothetical protein